MNTQWYNVQALARKKIHSMYLVGWTEANGQYLPRWGRKRHAIAVTNITTKEFSHPDFVKAHFTLAVER